MGLGMRMKNRFFWLLALVGVALDQVTKQWAVEVLQPRFEIRLWPEVFHLTYVENPGAAWSLFQDSGGFLKWVSLAVALILMVMALRNDFKRWEEAGYGLILAGAVGNGIDRFTTGYVVDLFNFTLIDFPVFNVADIAINLGVGCLIVYAILQHRQEAQTPVPEGESESGGSTPYALPPAGSETPVADPCEHHVTKEVTKDL